MKLEIKKETDEETLELYLEEDGKSINVMSKKGGSTLYEFKIKPDGSWTKQFSGHLKNEQ